MTAMSLCPSGKCVQNLSQSSLSLVWALFLAPVFVALASFIPAMLAVTQDPAETLRHDS